MKNKKGDDWMPLWIDKWIFGSTRIELTPDERSVWVDFIALSGKDQGYIRANETTPYQNRQLAGMLNIDEELLKRAIDKFLTFGKIKITPEGTIYLINYEQFELSERHKRRVLDEDFNPKYKRFIPCPHGFLSMATSKGYVRKSRCIVALALKRPLTALEEVHHSDGDENNDSPSNLMLFPTHKDHLQYQHGYEVKSIWDGSTLTSAEINDIIAEITALCADKRTPSPLLLSSSSSNSIKGDCKGEEKPKKTYPVPGRPIAQYDCLDLLGYFGNKYKAVVGYPYPANFGKEAKILKDLLGLYKDPKIILDAINIFYERASDDTIKDNWLKGKINVGIFKIKIPELLIQLREELSNE